MSGRSARRDGTGPARDTLEEWAAERYAHEDELLSELRAEMERLDFPLIQVPARTGLLLHVLLRAVGARRVIEVGTLCGYSAIWMGRALPADGRLLTLEKEPKHAALARSFLERAGLAGVVEVREGPASQLLPALESGAWDVVFLDADKEGYPNYLAEAARLLRPGGLVLADNAFLHGRVLSWTPDDRGAAEVDCFHTLLASSPEFTATVIPTGDGVAIGVRS